jgi:hypothetical protein
MGHLLIAAPVDRRTCIENSITVSCQSRSSICPLAAHWTREPLGAALGIDAVGGSGRNLRTSFSPTVGAPAKPVRMAFGALFIKQCLGLTDEGTVHQIRENAYMQFFLGFAGYSNKAPFDPSMMFHFRKRFSDEDLKRINGL